MNNNETKSPERLAAERIALGSQSAYWKGTSDNEEIIRQVTAPLHERIRELEQQAKDEKQIATNLYTDLVKAEQERDSLLKDKERINLLIDLIGVEMRDGGTDTVSLSKDDATPTYFVSVGQTHYHGPTLRSAIDSAISHSQSTKEGK